MSEKSLSVLDSFSIENVKEEAGDMDDVEIPIKKENTDEYLKPEVKQEEAEFCDSSESYEENSNLPVSEVKMMPLESNKKEKEDSNDVKLTLKQEEINIFESRENYQIAHSCEIIALDHHQDVFYCEKCNCRTSTAEQLEEHHAIMHKESEELVGKYKCDICAYETKHNGLIRRHKKAHVNQVDDHFKCATCGYETKYKGSLSRHQKLHLNFEEVEHYSCDACSYQTKFKDNLQKHKKIHLSFDEVEYFQCMACSFRSKSKSHLKGHQKLHLNRDEVEHYKCEFCDYRNDNLGNLKSHLLVHKNPDETIMYKCDVCQYETKRKRTLKLHVLKHLQDTKMGN